MEKILIPGIQFDNMEIKSGSLQTIDAFNEYMFNALKKPSKK